jgi:hypothetical protein
VLQGKIITQMDVPLTRIGSPGASPVITAKIWSSGGTVLYTSPTTVDPTTLSSTPDFNTKSFDFSSNTHSMVTGDRIGVEYTGTSDTNYVAAGYDGANPYTNSALASYEGTVWNTSPTTRDLAAEMWE